jgi:signal transduction histidine kinase
MLIFIGGMGGLGLRANRAFAQLVRLQIEAEELAEDLQRQKEIAERANLAKSNFLAAASHDLRQPVHALGLFVGALRGLALAKEALPLIDQIESSVNAMDGLFGVLLDVSRLDAGVVAVDRRAVAIRSILARVCADCAPGAEAKGVRLDWVGCSAVVDSDPVLLERIVRNLVSNAVRYTDRGRVLLGCRRAGGDLIVLVWDTGVGIPAGEQERIFQEYYQIGNAERDRAKGLGLGLAIVRRLTALLGAKLTLRSEPGKGSCFAIAVPLATGPASPSEPAERRLTRAPSGRLIVVVDDEASIGEGMAKLLAGWGYDVVAERSGDEAIARLATRRTRPRLVICDYRLRGAENGLDLIDGCAASITPPLRRSCSPGTLRPSS